jgi:hypothetical protein
VLALDALQLNKDACEKAKRWLRGTQQADGGWAPQTAVATSTGVTALAALATSADNPRRGAALAWVLSQAKPDMDLLGRLWFRLQGMPAGETVSGGFSWFPGTAAWVIPTSYAALFLKHCKSDPGATIALARAQRYICSRKCFDGGWNHGGTQYRSSGAGAYPETTGLALTALADSPVSELQASLALAQSFEARSQSAEGAALIHLGLAAHGLSKRQFEPRLPARTVTGVAWTLLALSADSSTNKLIRGSEDEHL